MLESVLSFSLSLWLGTYLISRDLRSAKLLLAGVSVVLHATAVALSLLHPEWSVSTLLVVLSAAAWALALYLFTRSEPPVAKKLLALLGVALPLLLAQTLLPALLISLALCVPAMTAAYIDASERDEALLPDVLRSFDYAAFMSLVFGAQVAVVMSIVGVSLPLIALLLGTITAAVVIQTFAEQAQTLLDRIAFFRWARLRSARAELRAVANALPRAVETPHIDQWSDEDFIRHTRRALSHFGDLPRLAGSPLIYLPAVELRLAQRQANDNTLERAVELKALLAESVARLKPRGKGAFGTTNEWRHYNALYYPYVIGLKPYSLRAANDELDDETQEVFRWFSTSVPERTLYNWQTAATRLVAHDLREQQQAKETV
ncbi:MAG: hypothetical protein U0694_11455 [Anaerolineae bacterium]